MQSSSMIHIACLLTLLVSAAAATAKAPLKYQAALSGAHLTLCPACTSMHDPRIYRICCHKHAEPFRWLSATPSLHRLPCTSLIGQCTPPWIVTNPVSTTAVRLPDHLPCVHAQGLHPT